MNKPYVVSVSLPAPSVRDCLISGLVSVVVFSAASNYVMDDFSAVFLVVLSYVVSLLLRQIWLMWGLIDRLRRPEWRLQEANDEILRLRKELSTSEIRVAVIDPKKRDLALDKNVIAFPREIQNKFGRIAHILLNENKNVSRLALMPTLTRAQVEELQKILVTRGLAHIQGGKVCRLTLSGRTFFEPFLPVLDGKESPEESPENCVQLALV